MLQHNVTLDDKYTLASGRAYMTGIEALVRLTMLQRERDRARGLNTAGFVSGYRGSPLGSLDQALWKAQSPSRAARRGVPSRRQRGPGDDRGARHAGSHAVSRRARRWRLRDVVRQGPGARSQHGRAEARQRRWHLEVRWRARGGGRRPRLQVLDAAAPVRARVHGRFCSRSQPCQCPGDSRPRPVRLGAVALLRLLGRLQGDHRELRCRRLRRHRPAPCQREDSRGVPAAARRRARPAARHAAGAGRAPQPLQDLRGARVRAREQPELHRDRQPASAPWHRDHRQVLARRAAGARGSRHRPRQGRRARHPRVQGRHAVAAGSGGDPRLRRGARGNPRGRGEALDHRGPAHRAALQLAGGAPPARDRRIRRARPLAAAQPGGADAGDGGARDREPHRPLLPERGHAAAARFLRPQGTVARRAARDHRAHAALLLGLSAQHLDRGARGQPCRRRHRLPLHGHVDGPQHRYLHADGRRGRDLDRAGAVHRDEARVPEPRRRHLLPLRHPRDPRRGGCRRQHHLQDPLQRRGRDDRRPADRRRAHGGAAHRADPRRGRAAHRAGQRRPGKIPARAASRRRSDHSSPRRARRRAARIARDLRHHRDHLRPDLRGREAAPAQEGQLSRSRRGACSSTSSCAKAAATAACSRTACRCCRRKPPSGASARSTRAPATRTSAASRASVPAS